MQFAEINFHGIYLKAFLHDAQTCRRSYSMCPLHELYPKLKDLILYLGLEVEETELGEDQILTGWSERE